jgi:hypothetical protein
VKFLNHTFAFCSILRRSNEGLIVKKIALWVALALAMPSMAFSFERRDGAYYCTEKFSAGLVYNDETKEWQGAVFRNRRNFVMKLSFLETVKSTLGSLNNDSDKYDVSITDEGSSVALPCLQETGEPPGINKYFVAWCNAGLNEYQFNFNNHRFIRVYAVGYFDGADDHKNTPSVSGGLCTKLQ